MSGRLPSRVTVVEVGPRDGLQNEKASLSVEDKVAFCDQLTAAGLPVVASAGAEPDPMVAPAGAVLTAPTPDAFAAGVARLLDDPALRETMGAAAQRFVAMDRTLETFQHRLAEGLAVLGLSCARSTSP